MPTLALIGAANKFWASWWRSALARRAHAATTTGCSPIRPANPRFSGYARIAVPFLVNDHVFEEHSKRERCRRHPRRPRSRPAAIRAGRCQAWLARLPLCDGWEATRVVGQLA